MPPLPPGLLLDLDDTIVSFSVGKADFWAEAFEAHMPPAHVTLKAFSQSVASVASEYWSDRQRAFRGRMDLRRARFEVADQALKQLGVNNAQLASALGNHFTDAKEQSVAPFPGAIETLSTLRDRGISLGLVTNGSSAFQRAKLNRYDLERLFSCIVVEGELGVGKPDPSPFKEAMSGLGLSAAEVWMVGDNLQADIAGAQALGIHAVWVDHAGHGTPAGTDAVPDHVIGQLSELLLLGD